MTTLTMLIGLATLGVETGWQPVDGGALEYIIQIEPSLLDALKNGESITSEIPADLKGVRRYRIVAGKAPLPRTNPSATLASAPAAPSGGLPAATLPTATLPTATLPTATLPTAGLPTAGLPGATAAPTTKAAASPPDRYALPFSQGGVPVIPKATTPAAPARPTGAAASPAAQPGGLVAAPPSNSAAPGGVSFPAGGPAPGGPVAGGGATATPSATPGSAAVPPVTGRYGAPAAAQPPPATNGPSASASPSTLQPDPGAANLAGATIVMPLDSASGDTHGTGQDSESDHPASAADSQQRKPWLPLTATLVGLFASLGGNLYLGWIAWDARRHYHRLVHQTVSREPVSVVELPEDEAVIVSDSTPYSHTEGGHEHDRRREDFQVNT